jgi:hypothetical protein
MFLQEMPEHTVTDAGKHVPSNPDQYHPSPLIIVIMTPLTVAIAWSSFATAQIRNVFGYCCDVAVCCCLQDGELVLGVLGCPNIGLPPDPAWAPNVQALLVLLLCFMN